MTASTTAARPPSSGRPEWPGPSNLIREVGPDDWPIWRHLRLASLTDSPEGFYSKLIDWQGPADCEERWRSRLLWKNSLNLAALAGDEPVGMVSGVPQEDGSTELISMWVDPKVRGSGLAAALVTNLLDRLSQARCWLRVHPDNVRAIGFYRKLGFQDRQLNEEGDLVMVNFRNF